jgi:large subunit ribosomal protein L21
MFAVVDIAGFQEMVSVGDTLRVPTLDAEIGKKVTMDQVLLVSDGANISTGTPIVDGASVELTILSHGRDKKIRVFKMKKRKRYRRTAGHRQGFTEVEVTKITASVAKATKAKSDAVKTKVEAKA